MTNGTPPEPPPRPYSPPPGYPPPGYPPPGYSAPGYPPPPYPASLYPASPRRDRASIRASVFVAFAAAAILTLATGAMAFSTFLFDDDGSGSIERSVLPALIPNVVVITLLFLGGNRLLEHHADGRWLLAVAAVLDAGISAGWAIFLDAGDAGAVVLAAAWLLAPAVLAALLAWTPGARRWTSRPLS